MAIQKGPVRQESHRAFSQVDSSEYFCQSSPMVRPLDMHQTRGIENLFCDRDVQATDRSDARYRPKIGRSASGRHYSQKAPFAKKRLLAQTANRARARARAPRNPMPCTCANVDRAPPTRSLKFETDRLVFRSNILLFALSPYLNAHLVWIERFV